MPRSMKGSFLYRLQHAKIDRTKVRYGVVCSEFEPSILVPNLKKIVEAARAASVDVTMDALFRNANDLVVNTAHAWGIGRHRRMSWKTCPPSCRKSACSSTVRRLGSCRRRVCRPNRHWACTIATSSHSRAFRRSSKRGSLKADPCVTRVRPRSCRRARAARTDRSAPASRGSASPACSRSPT